MTKPNTTVVAVAALLIVVALAALFVRYLAVRSVERADFGPLRGLFEAVIGGTIARGDVLLRPGRTSGEGAAEFCRQHPGAFKADVAYFETWASAMMIAKLGRQQPPGEGLWQSSASAPWIPLKDRLDAWDHPFCFQTAAVGTVVVSSGADALGAFECRSLKLPGAELAKLPAGRLQPTASGALVLLLRAKAD
jgi:hypothetical protein